MDPLADKLLITAALVSLVQMGMASAWIVAVIVGREFGITVLRSVAHARGISIPSSRLGKIKMVAEVVAILLLILGNQFLLPIEGGIFIPNYKGFLRKQRFWLHFHASPPSIRSRVFHLQREIGKIREMLFCY